MGSMPMYLNFSDPTILNFHQKNKVWPPQFGVVGQSGSAIKEDSWIYLIITATGFPFGTPGKNFVPAAHPVSFPSSTFE
jgi:hypothetical protein